jgi:hypothetical protein
MDYATSAHRARLAASWGLILLLGVLPVASLAADTTPSASWASRYQLGVGLAGLALIAAALIAIRASGSRLVKLGLKLAITAIAAGSVYAMYLSALNDRISAATHDAAHPATTGAALVEGGRGVAEKIPETINRTADATTGQARRTAGAVDQANQRLEHAIDTIAGEP